MEIGDHLGIRCIPSTLPQTKMLNPIFEQQLSFKGSVGKLLFRFGEHKRSNLCTQNSLYSPCKRGPWLNIFHACVNLFQRAKYHVSFMLSYEGTGLKPSLNPKP